MFLAAALLPAWYAAGQFCILLAGVECPSREVGLLDSHDLLGGLMIGCGLGFVLSLTLRLATGVRWTVPVPIVFALTACVLTIYLGLTPPELDGQTAEVRSGPLLAIFPAAVMLISTLLLGGRAPSSIR